MAFFDLQEEALYYAQKPAQVYELWPEHEQTFAVFSALESQWIVHLGFGGVFFQGIDYTRLESTMRLMQVPPEDWKSTFEGLRIMERAAKTVLNDKDKH